ncbi:MAG: hypothetical protein COC22_04680 [Flavobacteriaceae bacterium]|nr:MAG: hypothetical protein COC22_04680 [Flavobacteriaceae bacterium]
MKLTLKRISSTDKGTFGILLHEGMPFALTAERPWLNNKPNVSCIPTATYMCTRHTSPKFGEVLKVLNVDSRSDILFHKGNVPLDDSLGCILVGEQFGSLHGDPAVLASKQGFTELMSLIDYACELEIINA